MVALTGWSAPSSVPTGTSGNEQSMAHLNGYFVTAAAVNGDSDVIVRYATDATGTWSSATMPALPAGTDRLGTGPYRVSWDGTYYALCVTYRNALATVIKCRVLYATSLGGTWTSYEFDTSDDYQPVDFAYLNGEWVMVGTYYGADPAPAFIGTCSTPSGTWSFDTSAGGTGLDVSALSAGDGYILQRIEYAAGDYVQQWSQFGGATSGLQTSTSLSSGWAAPSSILGDPTYAYLQPTMLAHVNGYWFSTVWLNADGKPYLLTASDPTGTWSSVTPTNLSLNTAFAQLFGASWDGTNYVLAGGLSGAYSSYYPSTGAPDGTYSAVTSGLATSPTVGIVYVDPIHVVVQASGAIRYSNSIPFSLPSWRSTLRQRQSPKRTPSRVRGVDLRQRQTPYIR